MSAQLRYRTLIRSMGQVFAASDEERTGLLHRGLDAIVSSSNDWNQIKADTARLLVIWNKLETSAAATALSEQVLDLLTELASVPEPDVKPTLIITDKIIHISDFPEEAEAEEEEEEDADADAETEEEEEEVEAEEEEEEEEEVEAEEEAEEAEAEEEDSGIEVEQVFIRGRTYWLEPSTNKLYANTDDEIGEEVGAMLNGKPVFLTK